MLSVSTKHFTFLALIFTKSTFLFKSLKIDFSFEFFLSYFLLVIFLNSYIVFTKAYVAYDFNVYCSSKRIKVIWDLDSLACIYK